MKLIFLANKRVFWGIVLILLFIIFVLIKIAFTPTGNLPQENVAPTPKPIDLCDPFTTDPGEISCEEAKGIALTKISGKILGIDKKSMTFNLPNGKKPTYRLWFITIKLDKPAEIKDTAKSSIALGIDTTDGKIKYSEQQ